MSRTPRDEEAAPEAGPSPMQRAIVALQKARAKIDAMERASAEPIAIVGVGCRFPGGAEDPEAFWRALRDGVDAVRRIPEDRWPRDALAAERPETRWAGLLHEVDRFDAAFFNISTREANKLDPQQRLLLELVWEALENAGERPDLLAGSRASVFIGVGNVDYQQCILSRGLEEVEAYDITGNITSAAAGRISYTFGFQGPCVSLDTACSSSLVAIHLACQSLRNRESDLAVAGGVSLILSPTTMRILTATQALAPDSRCKTFDARANGYARGEGGGIVVLKRLSDAERDGDRIWALVRGSAVNQDGRSTGITAPNVLSQQALLETALKSARVAASEIGYIETHGTGTSLGDPIEVEALKAVLGEARADGSACVLGALKTNIGHLEAAAGVAGLIKALLALRHELIPRNLHFQTLNPRIDLAGTPFMIPTEEVPWKAGPKPRLAGVSSFGLSGTNAHVILEEAPRPRPEQPGASAEGASSYLLPLSAKSPEALAAIARAWQRWLTEGDGSGQRLHDIAYTASARRSHHEHRLGVVGASREELAAALGVHARGETRAGPTQGRPWSAAPQVVFVFPGQGSQWVGMGRRLLEEEPVFREALAACDAAIRREAGFSVLDELAADERASRLSEIDVAQPLLFAVEVALAALWRSWGVEPDAVVGHSMGEVAAAHVAGALTLEDAAQIICRRGRLLRRMSGHGAMAMVELPLESAQAELAGYGSRLFIAASNSPRATVISGEMDALEELLDRLESRGVFCGWGVADVASHSPQMEPLLAELHAALSGISPKQASIPMRSTVTTEPLRGDELSAAYWADNLRKPVLFSRVIRSLAEQGPTLFVEVSPHPILLPWMDENLREGEVEGAALPSLRRGQDERRSLLESLGKLYVRGYPVAWKRLYPDGGRLVEPPAYPWQRERYWVDAVSPVEREPSREGALLRSAAPSERRELAGRFVREQLADVLRVDESRLQGHTRLKELGIDSLMNLEIRNRLEAGLGLTLPATLLWMFPDIERLVEHLRGKLEAGEGRRVEPVEAAAANEASGPEEPDGDASASDASASWVWRPRPSPDARVRLLCLPYAGVGASRFRAWPDLLPPWVEVCPIQLPGKEERLGEPAFDAAGPLLDALLPALEAHLDRPFALFGCSVGALLAFEIARRLRALHGLTPRHFFAAACAAPHRPHPMREQLASLIAEEQLGDDPMAALSRLGIVDTPLLDDGELRRQLWPALRADLSLASRYTFEEAPPLDCPISVFGGLQDHSIRRDDLIAWHTQTTAAFQILMLPGGHLFMDTAPAQLLQQIAWALREEEPGGGYFAPRAEKIAAQPTVRMVT
ncbi:acyltransferase domain-containing protein [Sorangium sp. So ce134]